MAGTGPAPEQNRRRRNEPARGEWLDLLPLDEPVLPDLPESVAEDGWPPRTAAAWKAWREDPATGMYGPAEVSAALDLLELHGQWAAGKVQLSAEVRLRMDGLGLTAKGKKDLRWRVSAELEARGSSQRKRPAASKDRRARLSVVA